MNKIKTNNHEIRAMWVFYNIGEKHKTLWRIAKSMNSVLVRYRSEFFTISKSLSEPDDMQLEDDLQMQKFGYDFFK
jgi:hypothetical protein